MNNERLAYFVILSLSDLTEIQNEINVGKQLEKSLGLISVKQQTACINEDKAFNRKRNDSVRYLSLASKLP